MEQELEYWLEQEPLCRRGAARTVPRRGSSSPKQKIIQPPLLS
jgi:hypothetical protein